jgi:monoamine oxidase
MKRRDFIKTSLVATTGAAVIGCKTGTDPNPTAAYSGNVAIIGAGIAGLYTGYLLQQKNVKFTIYEASDRVGGRIKALKNFTDFDVDLGAEEIHGKRSVWYDWVKSTNATFVSETTADYYQIGGVLRTESLWAPDADFNNAIKLIEGATAYAGTDVTLQQYMDNNRLASRAQHIVNAKVANRYGGAANRLSVKGITEEDQLKSAGNENYTIANRTFASVMEEKLKDIIPLVTLNTPIARIDYSAQGDTGIIVEDAKGQKKTFDKVIITVPLTILQAGDLKFLPALPQAKTDAMNRIGMAGGMKVVMLFNKAFWAPDTYTMYGQNTIPEFYVTSLGRSKTSAVLTAFVTGSRAATLSAQGTSALNTILLELDSMYGKGNASLNLKNAYIMDWLKEPYIKGAYSYPIVGGGLNNRQELSRSYLKKLYFAGEATHYGGHSGTVHGAIETAQRAVNELLQEAA